MSLDTRRLGTVQSFFTVNGGVVDLSIKAESAGAASDLKAQMGKLEEFLSGAGLEIGSAEITVEASETPAPDIPEIRQAPRVPLSAYDYLA